MIITNRASLVQPYVRAVSQFREPVRGRISVTELLSPPQARSLVLEHWETLTEDAADRIWLFFGTAVHEYLAKFAGDDALAEERLEYTVDGWTVHGTPDYMEWLTVEDGLLIDWKTTKCSSLRYERLEWERQVNLYAHLLRLNGYPVAAVEVQAFLRDFDGARKADPEYPRNPVVRVPYRLWDAAEAHTFLWERIRLHKAAARGLYPPCTDEDRWMRFEWAAVKAGNTRATAKFPTREQAEQFARDNTEHPRKVEDWWSIEPRGGVPNRCLEWCNVAQHCGQHADWLLANQPAAEVI